MRLNTRIAIRHLRSRHSFGFISFSTILSIIGLAIGIASLIIISCISKGFSNVVNQKLSGIDGHIRINSYTSENISMKDISNLDSTIKLTSDNIKDIAPYIERHAIVRHNNITEGIILYGVTSKALNNIFNLQQFTKVNDDFINDESIIIGEKLAQILNAEIGDDLIILDIEKMTKEQILQAKKFTIINIFQTDFPEYDRLLAFIPIDSAEIFFNMDNTVSGLILNVDKPNDIELLDMKLSELISYPYITTTWKERHSALLEWLTLYDVPIKLVMIFISAVAIFNIAASLWMIIIEKTRDYGILISMGLSTDSIRTIIIKEGAFIGLAGTLLGTLISVIVLFLQKYYHFIHLPSDIYFMDYLPVHIDPFYFIIYPLIGLIITIAFSFYPAIRASKIPPAEALRYE